jgi:septum formation protein
MSLVLASSSPRRRELLESLGLSFSVCGAEGDGPIVSAEPGPRVVGHARFKAQQVAALSTGSWVLAADTLVFGAGEFFPKPTDRRHAQAMLERLVALQTHEVWTGCCLVSPQGEEILRQDCARVHFSKIDSSALQGYLQGTEWSDKAGAYAIQGWAGQYASLLSGDFQTVVGLSETAVLALFHQAGLPSDAFRR